MTTFGQVDANWLGSFLAPHIARKMIQEERRKAIEAPPAEKEAHFERANNMADSLGLYYLLKGMLHGRS